MVLKNLSAVVLTAALAFGSTACASSVDGGAANEGSASPVRAAGMEKKMDGWVEKYIEPAWGPGAGEYAYNPSTTEQGLAEGFEVTSYAVTYGDISRTDFNLVKKLSPNTAIECTEPVVNDTAGPPVSADQTVVETCAASAPTGAGGVSLDFSMRATWNKYEDGSTKVDLALANDGL